jgi:tRNA(His) 5'-end guanylyltransferase
VPRATTVRSIAGGLSTDAAYERLRGTVSEEKHEPLHESFRINYAKVGGSATRMCVAEQQRPTTLS